jgi:hypothetical protein
MKKLLLALSLLAACAPSQPAGSTTATEEGRFVRLETTSDSIHVVVIAQTRCDDCWFYNDHNATYTTDYWYCPVGAITNTLGAIIEFRYEECSEDPMQLLRTLRKPAP